MRTFSVGDVVEKVSGYKWPGVVVAKFSTLSGEVRYIVECTVPEVSGALHIYSEKQLLLTKPAPSVARTETGDRQVRKPLEVIWFGFNYNESSLMIHVNREPSVKEYHFLRRACQSIVNGMKELEDDGDQT